MPRRPAQVHSADAYLVAKPPQGDDWIHEAKFDSYRSQIVMSRKF